MHAWSACSIIINFSLLHRVMACMHVPRNGCGGSVSIEYYNYNGRIIMAVNSF